MSPSPRPLVSLPSPEVARAAVLFAFFRAGQTSIEAAHAAADPEIVPPQVTAEEVLATWRAVGPFASAWETFGDRLSFVAGVRTVRAFELTASALAYVYDAGAHFATEALDPTVYTPPPVPTRAQLEEVNQRLIRAGADVVARWLVRRNVARIVEKTLAGGRRRA